MSAVVVLLIILGCLVIFPIALVVVIGISYANLEITEWRAEYTDEDWHTEQLDDDGSDGI